MEPCTLPYSQDIPEAPFVNQLKTVGNTLTILSKDAYIDLVKEHDEEVEKGRADPLQFEVVMKEPIVQETEVHVTLSSKIFDAIATPHSSVTRSKKSIGNLDLKNNIKTD